MLIFPHDFWSMLIKEVGKTSWVPVRSLKTGSLERGRDHNYYLHKRKASWIQPLLFTFSGQSISTHIHTCYQASQQGSSSALKSSRSLFQDKMPWQRTLGGENIGRKRKAGIMQIRREENSRSKGHKSKWNQALLSTGCII